MRILYITDGGPGGVSSHVRCLTQCLKGVAEVMVCITYGSDALKKMLDEDGTPYCWCRCRNGHDLRLLLKVRRLIREFRPEVIHFHDIPLFVALYVKMLKRVRVFCTLHTPSARKVAFSRNLLNHAVQPCYFLPVSSQTWEVFKATYPKARGEVFFNPVRIGEAKSKREGEQRNDSSFVVGMVGRNADQKDWPSFHKVEEIVKGKVAKLRGCGVADEERQYALARKKVEGWLTGVTRELFVTALETLVEEKSVSGEYRFKRELEKELALEGAQRFFDEFSRKIVSLSDGRCVYFAPDYRSRGRNGGDLSRCWAEYAFHAVSSGGAKLIGKDYHERWYNPYKIANMDLIEPVLLDEQCVPVLKRNCAADAIKFFGKTHDYGNFDVVTRLDECGNAGANMTEVTFEASTKKIKSPRLVPLTEAVQTVVSHQTTAGSYPLDENNIPNIVLDDKGEVVSELKGLKVSGLQRCNVEFLNAGEKAVCDGRAAIAKMDLFVMTSKHEQLPTTVLECFMLGTPVCGFLPEGGTSDILQFSKGPVREAFIVERDCTKLADIVMDLLAHPEKRQTLVEDGRQILVNHFDAEKNCRGRLMEIYGCEVARLRGFKVSRLKG